MPEEKGRRRFVGKFLWVLLGALSGGASAVWAMYLEIVESIRQDKWGTLPLWFFAYVCVIFVAWMLHRDLRTENVDLRKQLDDRDKRDANLKFELARWIKSGEDLFDRLFDYPVPANYNVPRSVRVPEKLVENITEWQNAVDEFVKTRLGWFPE